jgi:hypothetical protein
LIRNKTNFILPITDGYARVIEGQEDLAIAGIVGIKIHDEQIQRAAVRAAR